MPSYVKNSSLAKRGGGPWEEAAKAPLWRPDAAGKDGGVREENASAYPRGPPRAAAPWDGSVPAYGGAVAHARDGADGWPRSNVGAVAHDGRGDGDGGNFSAVIGTPCVGGADTGGGSVRGGSDRWRSTAMACLMSATDSVRSRRPMESSWFERTGAGSRAGAVMAADAGGGAMEVGAPDEAIAVEAVDGPEDIATEESDTKLVETRVLACLGRRL